MARARAHAAIRGGFPTLRTCIHTAFPSCWTVGEEDGASLLPISLSQPPLSFPLIAQAHVVPAFQSARIVRVLASVAAVIAYMLTHNLMRYRLTARPLAARVCYNRNV